MAGVNSGIRRTKETPKPYRCSECSINFARPSHLARHAVSHQPEAERNFGCPRCEKTFARHDVLLRHLRGVHSVQRTKKPSARRSCLKCVQKKLKCDRKQPCESCSISKSVCEYKVPSLYPVEGNVLAMDDSTKESPAAEIQPQPPLAVDLQPSSQAAQSPLQGNPLEGSICPPQSIPMMPTGQSALSYPGGPLLGDASSLIGFGDAEQSIDPLGLHMNTDANIPISDASFSQGVLSMGALALGYGGLDWLDFQLQEPMINPAQVEHPHPHPIPSEMAAPNSGVVNNFYTPILSHGPLTSTSSPNAVDMLPLKTEFPGHSIQSWPFAQSKDHVPEQPPSRYKLPPLEEVLRGSSTNSHTKSKTPIEALIEILSKPRIPDTSAQDPEIFLGMHLLQRIIDCYFSQFHDILAIIHVPTFSIRDCSTVLLASMACIGAMHLQSADAQADATALCDLCSRMILWLGGSDSRNYSNLTYLMSCCLYQIYSLGSGNRQLYQDADRSRGTLIGGLRGMGLLKSQISIDPESAPFKLNPHSDPLEVENEWLRWRDQEQERRVVWASFEYDCSLSTLTGCRAAVDLAELPRALPCAEDLWRAPSGQTWRSLASHLGPSAFGIPVTATLEPIMSGSKALPSGLSSWGKRLCCQVIGRLLWDLKQLEVISLTRVLRQPSLSLVQEQAKNGLLKGFDNISNEIKLPTSPVEVIDYNIARLIVHYCNLFSVDNVMELILYIVRHLPTTQHPSEHRTMTAAKHQLNMKFANDPSKTRKLVWHAAQIHAVANEYVVSAPCEILRVFMGAILLLAFSKYCPKLAASDEGSASDRPMVFLDRLDPTNTQAGLVEVWIKHGGPASLSGVSDIHSSELAATVCRRTQGLLEKAQCWGLSNKFVKILHMFQDAEI